MYQFILFGIIFQVNLQSQVMSYLRWKDIAMDQSLVLKTSKSKSKKDLSKSRKYAPNRSMEENHSLYLKTESSREKQIESPSKLLKKQTQIGIDQSFRLDIVKRKRDQYDQIDSPTKKHYKLVPKTSPGKLVYSPVKESQIEKSNQKALNSIKKLHVQFNKFKALIIQQLKTQRKFIQSTLLSLVNNLSDIQIISKDKIENTIANINKFSNERIFTIEQSLQDSLRSSPIKLFDIQCSKNNGSENSESLNKSKKRNLGKNANYYSQISLTSSQQLSSSIKKIEPKEQEKFSRFFAAVENLKKDITSMNQIKNVSLQKNNKTARNIKGHNKR